MSSRKAPERRVIANGGAEFATVAYMSLLESGDIYCGPQIALDGDPMGRERFRQSFHRDGSIWRRVRGKTEQAALLVPPKEIFGLIELAGVGNGMTNLEFHRHKKGDTRTRQSLIVDLGQLNASGFGVNMFAIERSRIDLLDARTENMSNQLHLDIVGVLIADWTSPAMAMVAWSMLES